MNAIRIVGLTGQTGAGKSSVSKIIKSQGMPVIDCDEVAHDVVEHEKQLAADLVLAFSITILRVDGTLNRKRLGQAVFGNPKKLERLNTIIFPYIRKAIRKRIQILQKEGASAAVLDAPTLFESGADQDCDAIISVVAPVAQRLNRIVVRDHLSDDEARRRIASQHDDLFYTGRSQYVIQNDASLEDLHVKTLETLEKLKGFLAQEPIYALENKEEEHHA